MSLSMTEADRSSTAPSHLTALSLTTNASSDVPNDQKNPSSNADGLSDEMAALYDRQLRLWGVDVQTRLGKAHLLIVRCGAVMAELAKNLVLGGIGKVTVCDEDGRVVTEQNRGNEFLLPMAENGGVGMKYADAVCPHLRTLSPYTKVESLTVPSIPTSITPNFLAQFDIVAATDLPYPTMCALNDAARIAQKPFLAVCTIGPLGYAFADLGEYHEYVLKRTMVPTGKEADFRLWKSKTGPVSKVREIVSVETDGVQPGPAGQGSGANATAEESKAGTASAPAAQEEITERVLTRDRYVPFREAMSQPLPADIVRRAVRQNKHAQAVAHVTGRDAPPQPKAPTEVTILATTAICMRALYAYESDLLDEARSVPTPSEPGAFEAFAKHVSPARDALGLPASIAVPDFVVLEQFWGLYTATLGTTAAAMSERMRTTTTTNSTDRGGNFDITREATTTAATTTAAATTSPPPRSRLLAAQIIGSASCLGGTLAEQVISLIGKREPVLQNWLLFDGNSFAAPAVSMIDNGVAAGSGGVMKNEATRQTGLMPTAATAAAPLQASSDEVRNGEVGKVGEGGEAPVAQPGATEGGQDDCMVISDDD